MRSTGSLRTVVRATFVMVCASGCDGAASTSDELGEKTFEQLSNIEVMELCPSVRERVIRLVRAFNIVDCTLLYHEKTTCEDERAACLAVITDATHSGEDMYSCDEANAETAGAACREITVTEYDDCLDATLAQMESIADSLSCTSATSALARPPVPKACTQLGKRCPALSDP